MTFELKPTTSAAAIAAAISSKKISAKEVEHYYRMRVERLNPRTNALVWIRSEDFEGTPGAGLLSGVPLPIKDLSETAGQPTTAGSLAVGSSPPLAKVDSAAVSRIRAAGANIFARSNTPEFGILPVTENVRFGATNNPWNEKHTAGGSSGGAAAAVAAGLAPIAHGSDGGGSIRIPASCCNLVGLKVSRGLIPKGPTLGETMHGMAVDGCLSRTVRDTALFLDVATDFDDLAWHSVAKRPYLSALDEVSSEKIRLQVDYGGMFGIEPHPEVAAKVDEIAGHLERFGATRLATKFAWPARYGDDGRGMAFDFFRIWYTGTAYSALRDFSSCEKHTQAIRRRGLETSSIEYIESLCRLQVFTRYMLREFRENLDILVMPTIAPLPPKHGHLRQSEGDADALMWRSTEMVPYTGWCNVTGQPAISVPAGFSKDGLPIGVQLVGRVGSEVQLLKWAEKLERELEWDKAMPREYL